MAGKCGHARAQGHPLQRVRAGMLAVVCLGAAALYTGRAHAAQLAEGSTPRPAHPGTELEQVDVVGRSLRQMRRELLKVQDRFFARYNDLNLNNDFDVHCAYRAATGSQRRVRQCRTEFILDVTGQQGRDFTEAITSGRLAFAAETPPASIEWLRRREEFRENVRQAMRASPELQELIRRWLELQTQYDRALKERDQAAP